MEVYLRQGDGKVKTYDIPKEQIFTSHGVGIAITHTYDGVAVLHHINECDGVWGEEGRGLNTAILEYFMETFNRATTWLDKNTMKEKYGYWRFRQKDRIKGWQHE